jgi:hypothetical protein
MKTETTCIVLLVTLFVFSSCSSDTVTPGNLRGTWVERTARKDTLVFDKDLITVRRGKSPNASGYLVPKSGSGLYSYELKAGTLRISRSMYSSSMPTMFEYPVKISGRQLTLPNFYELTHHFYGEEDRKGQKTLRYVKL